MVGPDSTYCSVLKPQQYLHPSKPQSNLVRQVTDQTSLLELQLIWCERRLVI